MAKKKGTDHDLAEQISKKTSQFIRSSSHRDLLDIVDSLRSHGLSHYIDLPQIMLVSLTLCSRTSGIDFIQCLRQPVKWKELYP